MANKRLNAAKTAKKDEFYTQLSDIERELQHYENHFKGKIVLCNCDDPYESNFFKYFALSFNRLGLKKLICTCYNGSPVQGKELSLPLFPEDEEHVKPAFKVEITEVKDLNGDGAVNLSDVRCLLQNSNNALTPLKTGDFRSEECVRLLAEADVVVTNPPFSLFREYIRQLTGYGKKFLIVGHQNAITYKEVFPLIKDNKVWLGYGFKGQAGHFISPYEDIATASDHRQGMIRVSGVTWFTNMEIPKRNEEIELVCRYSPEEYPRYDNYDAIEVSKTLNIPYDYAGVMGVPITFLDKYNPQQFDIIGMCENMDLYKLKTKIYSPEECRKAYFDKFGKNGTYDLNASAVIIRNSIKEKIYQRILIRNKHPKI